MTLPRLAVPLIAILLACGGGRSDTTTPAAGSGAGSGGGSGSDSGSGAGSGGGDSGSGGSTTVASCSRTLLAVDSGWTFTEQCDRDGQVSSRSCELQPDGTAWSCTCKAGTGATSACSAPARSGVITAPAPCCPE